MDINRIHNIPDPENFIYQTDILDNFIPRLGIEQWQMVSGKNDTYPNRFGIWCSLMSEEAVNRALNTDGWDLMAGEGQPGFIQTNQETEYQRYCVLNEGVRPFVLYRSFYGAYHPYLELDEEFRLYHNLADDQGRGLLLSFDESGREIEVAKYDEDNMLVHLKFIKQFLAGTGWYLAVFIDSVRHSTIDLGNIPNENQEIIEKNDFSRWRRNIVRSPFMEEEYGSMSRLLAKVFITPPTVENSGIWPFEKSDHDREVDFIVRTDENGNEIEHSSNPSNLNNNFNTNPEAPQYLTPVYFRNEVLQKYYENPNLYNVSDGRISCLDLWGITIDNDNPDFVVAFLGDLGRDLPYRERLHWKDFNISPQGNVSHAFFSRNFLAQFTNAESSDLEFRRKYPEFNRDWEEMFGWNLFLPVSEGDEYLLDTLRVPVTQNQNEFDDQIGKLTKLLIDSLNEKEIYNKIENKQKDMKGIDKLEVFFEESKYPNKDTSIAFLRNLQFLRSTGFAHRKGRKYKKALSELNIEGLNCKDSFKNVLNRANVMIGLLREYYFQ